MIQLKSANSQLIKNLNQQLVLNLIRKRGSISGAELAKITQLQPATTSKILKTLDDLGMVRDAGVGQSTRQGGKRPTLWRLKPAYGYVIGIEILSFELRGVLLDFDSKIINEVAVSVPGQIDSDNIADFVHGAVRMLCKSPRVAMKDLIGVALGVSGLVQDDTGVVKYSIDLGLQDFSLRQIIEERLKVNVVVDNDANAAAVGEKWMGCGSEASHLVYMIVNESITGIGCGIILNGELFRGITNSAGELTLALPALRELRSEDLEQGYGNGDNSTLQDSLTMSSLIASAREGDGSSRRILEKLGKILAQEVARILDFVNPELIIFGGDIVEAADLILEPIRQEVKNITLEAPFHACEIRMTGFGQNAVAIGAASLIFKKIFKKTQSAVKHVFEVPNTRASFAAKRS